MGKYNSVGNANGGFLGTSSFKPIAGHVVRDLFIFRLNQAKVTGGAIAPATPVKLVNSNGGKAGEGLSPNVFVASAPAATTDISGFLVASPNDVLEIGSGVAIAQEGQIAQVAVIGSGIEIYLPCDDTLQNVNINSKAEWDITSGKLKLSDTGNISIVGSVVDGITYSVSNGVGTTIDSKVILVKL